MYLDKTRSTPSGEETTAPVSKELVEAVNAMRQLDVGEHMLTRLMEASLDKVRDEVSKQKGLHTAYAALQSAVLKHQGLNDSQNPNPVFEEATSMLQAGKILLACQSGISVLKSKTSSKAKGFQEKLGLREISMQQLPVSLQEAVQRLIAGHDETAQ